MSRCCGLDVDLSVVSRHLAQLRDCDLVRSEKEGKSVLYSANAGEIADHLRKLADALDSCACCARTYRPPRIPT